MIEKNVNLNERITRLILGFIFIITMLYYVTLKTIGTLDVALAIIFVLLAIIMFVTAIIGTCPIYSALKVNTHKS